VYGSETLALKFGDVQRMMSTERMMVRWMCGVSLRMRRCRLRWFGHVERKSGHDWVSKCRDLVVEGVKGVGRRRKKCME
jgi:hypothetical protein